MSVNRAQLVYSGGGMTYTLPINPIEFEDPDSVAQNVVTGVDGNTAIVIHGFDSRPRTMTWIRLPNWVIFNTMINQLKYIMAFNDIVLKKRDLNRNEVPDEQDTTPIKIMNVETKFGKNAYNSIHNLGFDSLVLTYKLRRT